MEEVRNKIEERKKKKSNKQVFMRSFQGEQLGFRLHLKKHIGHSSNCPSEKLRCQGIYSLMPAPCWLRDALGGITFLSLASYPSVGLRKTPMALEKSLEKEAGRWRCLRWEAVCICGNCPLGLQVNSERGQGQTEQTLSVSATAHLIHHI